MNSVGAVGPEHQCPVVHWEFGDGPLPALTAFERMNGFGPQERIVRVDEAQGYFMVTNHELASEVLRDPTRFSNKSLIPVEPDPQYAWIPLMIDPPNHTAWRHLLAPHFTPKRAQAMSEAIRQRCNETIDGIVDLGEIDFVEDFARRFPTSVFLDLFGLQHQDLDQFLEWEFAIMHPDNETDPYRVKFLAAMQEVTAYFSDLINARRADPDARRTDLLSVALEWKIDGDPIPVQDLLSFCLFMFIAGLDTVTSQLGYMFHHLATHEGDRMRIVSDSAVHAQAVEESLRFHTIISTARKVVADTEIAGCPVKAGEMISVPLAGANRDSAAFANAHLFDVDRDVNRHLAFGVGPHRCLGAHLARLELRIALKEWHKRIPDYWLAPHANVLERTAATWGLDSLLLAWNR